jgi:hypothetical protein
MPERISRAPKTPPADADQQPDSPSRTMIPEMTLRDFLSVPYLLEAETVELEPGRWVRRAAYPELSDCAAEAPTIVEALARLERRRVETIVAMLQGGALPPVPRRPLADCDPEGVMQRAGLHDRLAGLLDHTPARLRGSTDAGEDDAHP